MYLSIPKGMQYAQITEHGISTDYFIDPLGIRPRINLQEQIKEALRHNAGRKKEIKLAEFTIYLKDNIFMERVILKYTPNQNGALATLVPAITIDKNPKKPSVQTSYGTLWHKVTPLTEERLQKVIEACEQQKADRRHWGDSPKAT
jgi:hypothetical protein